MTKFSAGLLVLLAVFAVFARTVGFSYIALDDAAYTFRNPFVAGGLSVCNIVEAFSNLRHGGIWMPVTYMSYMADVSLCRLFSLPLIGWMHFGNVLLHAANSLLLLILAGRFVKRAAGDSVAVSALVFPVLVWALHPLRVEPVAWIAARKELLWTLFALAAILCAEKGRSTASKVFCALSCLSKPTAVCLPFIFILCDWFAGRLSGLSFRKAAFRYVPLFLMAAVTGGIAAYSQTHVAGQDATELFVAPLSHRLVNALSAIGFYLKSIVWPFSLHIDCRAVPGAWPLGATWNLVVLALCALSAAIVFLRRRNSGFANGGGFLIFCVAWFMISLFPTLGVIGNFGMEAHADRFVYLPAMAISFLIARISIGTTFRILIFSALTAVASVQLGYWKDNAAAHARALECDAGHPRALVHVADSKCSRRRDFDGGIEFYRKALSLESSVPKGGFNAADTRARLAYALASRGRQGDFREVLALGADVLEDNGLDRRGMMLDALGTAFMHVGDFKRAAALFRASIDAPDRFWPKASTKRKLGECIEKGG